MADKDIDLKEENGVALVGTAIVFLAISWISIALRTYTRAFLMKGYQADDWLMLIGQLIFTVSCVFILIGVHDGLGRHNEAIEDDHDEVNALMWQALATATYVLDMMFIKLSIGVFLLRLSVQKVYTWILWVSLAIITVWSCVIFFWDIFQCSPVAKQWDFRITTGQCVSADQVVAAAYSISVMTILSDWLYALLPVPMLWTVKMTKQAKATVIVILGLGVFASIATLIRLRFLADLTDTNDILFAGTDAMVWTLVEPGVAIVASSLATIRPLLRAMKIKGFESTDHTYGTGRSGTGRSGVTRSKSGTLPGFGPNDVSLSNVVSEFNTGSNLGPINNRGPLPFHNKSLPAVPLSPGQQSTVKSEIYVIQGNHGGSPPRQWHARAYSSSSPNGSIDQMHDLEAQSQEDGTLWPR
ncbi:hypothetical protein G7Z17_g7819 [Cylindrodendrum hubeiense]|uniref:Rhodopsin domain-containing protein n=1 Tax=Cylindrodendrum hubeiense TaxID=595255 RepID=A0A9P5H347_9HYPO|nr:hypothetical protein G7Z17_g7819 [Cylindrodendrum hubeiense]